MELQRLVALAAADESSPYILEDAVEDFYREEAAGANQDGTARQIRVLVEAYGVAWVEDLLSRAQG